MRHLTVRSLILVLAVTVLPWSIAAFGQFGGGRAAGGGVANGPTGGNCLLYGARNGGNGSQDTSDPRPNIDRSGFVYARIKYNIHRNWPGGELPWHHDYPDADAMLPDALKRLTGVHTSRESFQIVDIDSEEIFKYPFVYMAEPGFLDLHPDDLENLREYLDRGGFLFIDDFRGRPGMMDEYENFVVQLKKLYPDRELRPVDHTHKIFHTFFDTDPRNMLPPYRRPNSGDVQFFALSDEKERVQIMVHFNNDAGEYWQTLDVGSCSINESGLAVQLGINYVIYAMTH